MSIVNELRNKTSRDNRELLDRAATEIERLQREVETLRIQRDFAVSCITPNCIICQKKDTCEYAETGIKNPFDCFVFGDKTT